MLGSESKGVGSTMDVFSSSSPKQPDKERVTTMRERNNALTCIVKANRHWDNDLPHGLISNQW
jgi:hypothetical protein